MNKDVKAFVRRLERSDRDLDPRWRSRRATAIRPALMRPLCRVDCPDPCLVRTDVGWLLTGTTYFDDVEDKFPLWLSSDLSRWTPVGHVFPRARTPHWATTQFWAPEIHRVGMHWLCYFTARDRTGRL